MNEQDDFFTRQHELLLNTASWAKYLAWIVLVIFSLWAIGTYIQEQNNFFFNSGTFNQTYRDFVELLIQFPSYVFCVLVEIIGAFLRGVVYFLVLKGISLGLNMIVETDINYREQKGGHNE